MRSVSKLVMDFAAAAAVIVTIAVQPVFAAGKTPEKRTYFESLVRRIVRVLDTIDIRFPPG
jgi:hypothetical protein